MPSLRLDIIFYNDFTSPHTVGICFSALVSNFAGPGDLLSSTSSFQTSNDDNDNSFLALEVFSYSSPSLLKVASSRSGRQIRNERKFDSISVPLSPDLHLNLLHTNMLHSFPAFKSFWALRKQKSTRKEEKLNFWMKSGWPARWREEDFFL